MEDQGVMANIFRNVILQMVTEVLITILCSRMYINYPPQSSYVILKMYRRRMKAAILWGVIWMVAELDLTWELQIENLQL